MVIKPTPTVHRRTGFYIIQGDPIPLARARHGNGRTWDPQKHLKLHWGLLLADQHKEQELFSGPLELDITFHMPIPKTSKKQTELMNGAPHHCRPDLDNLCKWVLDVCNTICYRDDALFTTIVARKVYSKEPRTEFTITQVR